MHQYALENAQKENKVLQRQLQETKLQVEALADSMALREYENAAQVHICALEEHILALHEQLSASSEVPRSPKCEAQVKRAGQRHCRSPSGVLDRASQRHRRVGICCGGVGRAKEWEQNGSRVRRRAGRGSNPSDAGGRHWTHGRAGLRKRRRVERVRGRGSA